MIRHFKIMTITNLIYFFLLLKSIPFCVSSYLAGCRISQLDVISSGLMLRFARNVSRNKKEIKAIFRKFIYKGSWKNPWIKEWSIDYCIISFFLSFVYIHTSLTNNGSLSLECLFTNGLVLRQFQCTYKDSWTEEIQWNYPTGW